MGRKNLQGGNKTKAMKNYRDDDREIRTIQSEEEEYAIVTAVCGNGRFKVTSHNNQNYMALLPGSMRGSKKRKFYVENNSILLINNRSTWQTIKPNSTVDIDHVYSQNHISILKLQNYFLPPKNNNNNNDDIIHFENDHHHDQNIHISYNHDYSNNHIHIDIQNI
jgi:initiation factor 1A